jgi:uncharacterized glyoxalase superfamily protein PhnB
MHAKEVSTCLVCADEAAVDAAKSFYVEHFAAAVTFDCGWYVNLRFGGQTAELQFMAARNPDQPVASGSGVVHNFLVDDVDAEHERLSGAGLEVVMELADHPWGDRGFAIAGPLGVTLYVYAEREASDEFKQYYSS